ncbi:hypothetical protein [Sphingomonas cavernae]|uniref:Uncharacterized protein n=1 Tax=Sphingomonas cavernae TaxID=2320861 RepID=A0A418WQH3_9SPHN|nr:hypothetical protein [Sphingomonas cavernae]RJF93497.1 hypothetical protein D3876_04025 [Sphingomonas cavernae]
MTVYSTWRPLAMPEWLVLLDDAENRPEGVKIVAQSGRVAVCQVPAAAPAPCGAIDPDALPSELTDGERLFIEGWRARASKDPKTRKGEGLPWDAPGYQPPDLPPRRKP